MKPIYCELSWLFKKALSWGCQVKTLLHIAAESIKNKKNLADIFEHKQTIALQGILANIIGGGDAEAWLREFLLYNLGLRFPKPYIVPKLSCCVQCR